LLLEITKEAELTSSEEAALLKIQAVLEVAQAVEGLTETVISLVLVTDEAIRVLNKEHRAIDAVTDVLSFPLATKHEPFVTNNNQILLGDIVLAMPRVRAQAAAYGHTILREMAFLVVHSFLHLVGYEHSTLALEQEMFVKQEKILKGAGITK
jgi:probable rRNA maturation factor